MFKKVIIVFIVIFIFIVGVQIGKITERPLLPSFNIEYPEVFNVNSPINSFDGYTGEQIEKVLKGTPLQGLGFWFSYYAWQNDVSALYLTAHAVHESGWGTSWIAKRKHNLFGFGAYDSSPYWSANYYPTYQQCIKMVSAFISKNYLTESGIYYVAPTLKGMNVHYATDKNWSSKIVQLMNYLHSKIGEPNKTLAVAENSYYQDFQNKDYDLSKSFDKYVSKGQFIRDLYMLFPVKRNYKSAGAWAISLGLVKNTPKWWINKITRKEETNIINKLYNIYYPYKEKPKFNNGTFYERYDKYYCILIYKLENEK